MDSKHLRGKIPPPTLQSTMPMKKVWRALRSEAAPLYFETENPGKCLHGSISILPTETFHLAGGVGSRAVAGSLISCPIQHMVLLSVINVQTFTDNYSLSEEGWRLPPPHFLSCHVPGLLMQSASTFRVFTIYTVNYLTVQDYFHYWDWQAISCQDRTRVFFSIGLNVPSLFGLNTLTLD